MKIFLLGATPSIVSAPGDDPMTKLAKTGGNTGNQIIAHGLLGRIQYEDISWDYSIDPREVKERFDIFVIAAANFLFPAFDFGGMADYIEKADLPVAIVGLGAQSSSYDPDIALHPGTERFVKVIAERAPRIGVRGPFTQAVLARRGVHNVTVTGCPSYYMGGPEGMNLVKRDFDAVQRICVNASRDVIKHAFDADKMLRLSRELYGLAVARQGDFIAQSEHAEIRLADQPSAPGAASALDEIGDFLRGIAPDADVRAWAKEHVKVYFDVDEWLTAMRQYDFVLGTRFHGNMVALQEGIPAMVVCHDTRTEDMCRFLGMPWVTIMEIDRIDVKALYDKIDSAAVRARYIELYSNYVAFLTENRLLPK